APAFAFFPYGVATVVRQRREKRPAGPDVRPGFRIDEVEVGDPYDRRAVGDVARPAKHRQEILRHGRWKNGTLARRGHFNGLRRRYWWRLHGWFGCGFLGGAGKGPDLGQRQWASQVAHDPARLKYHGPLVVHISHEKYPAAEARQQLFELGAVQAARRSGSALEPFDHSHLVALRLEPSDEPRAAVRKAFVVQVHRVLRREHDAQPERPRLLEQREHRQLRRWIGRRREVTKNLIHVEDGAQAARTGLRPHPRKHL